jgi:hypothetical protein
MNCGTGKWKMTFSSLKQFIHNIDIKISEDVYSQPYFFTEIPTLRNYFPGPEVENYDWTEGPFSAHIKGGILAITKEKLSTVIDTSCKVIWAMTLSGMYVPMFWGTYCHHLQGRRPQYHSSAVKTPNLTHLQSNIFVMSETHSQYAH